MVQLFSRNVLGFFLNYGQETALKLFYKRSRMFMEWLKNVVWDFFVLQLF